MDEAIFERMTNDINALLGPDASVESTSIANTSRATQGGGDATLLETRPGMTTRSRTAARTVRERSASCAQVEAGVLRDNSAPASVSRQTETGRRRKVHHARVAPQESDLAPASVLGEQTTDGAQVEARLARALAENSELRDDNTILRFERDCWRQRANNTADERLASAEQVQEGLREQLLERQQQLEAKDQLIAEIETMAASTRERFEHLQGQQENVHGHLAVLIDAHEASNTERNRLTEAVADWEQQHTRDEAALKALQQHLEESQQQCATQAAANRKLRDDVLRLQASVAELQDAALAPAPAAAPAEQQSGGSTADWRNVSTMLSRLTERQERQEEFSNAMLTFVQSGRSSVSSSAGKLRPPTFDPAVYEWDVFEARFDAHCRNARVPTDGKLSLLTSLLQEEVYKSLYEAGLADSTSWTEVTTFLRETYSLRRMPEDFEREYQTATRREGEALTKLAERLQALKRRGGGTTTPRLLSVRFIEAVGDAPWAGWLQNYVMSEDITSFRFVVDKAIRLEKGQCSFQKVDVNVVRQPALQHKQPRQPPPQAAAVPSAEATMMKAMEQVFSKVMLQFEENQAATLNRILDALQAAPRAPPTSYAAAAKQQQPQDSSTPPQCPAGPPRQRNPNARCFGCGLTGHFVRECPWFCDYCMRKGHSTENCRVPRALNGAGGAYAQQ